MNYAIMLRDTGGPDKLRYERVDVPDPRPGELQIRHTAIGVNFHDTYVRSGLYDTLKLPGIPGLEAAAVVEKVGAGVQGFAAGGVGQPLVRWAKHLGATVIATVGSEEKAEIARQCGADHVILYRSENFVDRVAQITGGKGVEVVYDSVGADTFSGSLDCLDYLGVLVNFGQSSGPVPPFAVSRLAAKSNTIVRPMLFHYIRGRAALEAVAGESFEVMEKGIIRPQIGLRLPLSRAAEAHTRLESRATTGQIVLVP
jgi:NADPH:quinone reductase-like Zn-dependent oxidoreductase